MTMLFLPLLIACNSPLYDGSWKGEPLLEIGGRIVYGDDPPPIDGGTGLTLIWAKTPSLDPVMTNELDITMNFPNDYALRIYDPPPADAAAHVLPNGLEGPIGTVLLFMDENLNGTLEPEAQEPIFGVAMDTVLFWDDSEDAYSLYRVDPYCDGAYMVVAIDTEVELLLTSGCEQWVDFDCNGDIGEWGEFCQGG